MTDPSVRQARLSDLPCGATSTIRSMERGRTYFAVPWAMHADQDSLLWLDQGEEVHACASGTASMRIELRDDGVHVWADAEHRSLRPSNLMPSRQWVPVAVLEKPKGARS
jgi:hypothetical protein